MSGRPWADLTLEERIQATAEYAGAVEMARAKQDARAVAMELVLYCVLVESPTAMEKLRRAMPEVMEKLAARGLAGENLAFAQDTVASFLDAALRGRKPPSPTFLKGCLQELQRIGQFLARLNPYR